MPNVILQPCGNGRAYDHFQRTVSSQVLLPEIRKYFADREWRKLESIYPKGTCSIWGVEPQKGGNVKKWEKIGPGDFAFFARQMVFIASGQVTFATHNRQLALRLWGERRNHSTWEYIYFLSDVRPMAAPVADFNVEMGYDASFPVRSFNVLQDLKKELALYYFGLESLIDTSYPSARAAMREVKKPVMGRTDKEVKANQRQEQNYLTRALHKGKKYNECAICHRRFPVSFLVTAHIKRRSHCSHEERWDSNVVMPLCNMGCDQLYERGYVSVLNGIVVPRRKVPATFHMKEYLDEVLDNECLYYSTHTHPYFEWHWDFHQGWPREFGD